MGGVIFLIHVNVITVIALLPPLLFLSLLVNAHMAPTITMGKITRDAMRSVTDIDATKAITIITMALNVNMILFLSKMSTNHNKKEGPILIRNLFKMSTNRTAKQTRHPLHPPHRWRLPSQSSLRTRS